MRYNYICNISYVLEFILMSKRKTTYYKIYNY